MRGKNHVGTALQGKEWWEDFFPDERLPGKVTAVQGMWRMRRGKSTRGTSQRAKETAWAVGVLLLWVIKMCLLGARSRCHEAVNVLFLSLLLQH